MLIDFSEIPTTQWRRFEDLICDLLEKEGYHIKERAGVGGPDGGRDILAVGYLANSLEQKERTYLVSCKHLSRPVKESEVENIRDKMEQHGADGFLLAALEVTNPLQQKLTKLGVHKPVRYWIRRDIENLLRQHKDIFRKYLPESFERVFGVAGLIPEAELMSLFNRKYHRNPRLDELVSWRKDTVNYGITDVGDIEKILKDRQIRQVLDELYEKHLSRKVDPVGHLTWGFLFFRQPSEETKREIEWHIKNSDEYWGRVRIRQTFEDLPKSEILFDGVVPRSFYGWRPYHSSYAKGILRTSPGTFPPCIELESVDDSEFRIEWSAGRRLFNKNTIVMEVGFSGFFQSFVYVVGANNRPYFVQYIFDKGEARRVVDSGVQYAQHHVGVEFPFDAKVPKSLQRNVSEDLKQLCNTDVGYVVKVLFGVKGKAKIARILFAE